MNAEEKRAERRIALCGTETYWPTTEPAPYLTFDPTPADVYREFLLNMETTE